MTDSFWFALICQNLHVSYEIIDESFANHKHAHKHTNRTCTKMICKFSAISRCMFAVCSPFFWMHWFGIGWLWSHFVVSLRFSLRQIHCTERKCLYAQEVFVKFLQQKSTTQMYFRFRSCRCRCRRYHERKAIFNNYSFVWPVSMRTKDKLFNFIAIVSFCVSAK